MHSLLLAPEDGCGWGLPHELYHMGVALELSDWLKGRRERGCGDNQTIRPRVELRV